MATTAVTKNDSLLLEYSEMQHHVFCELPEIYRFIILAKGRRAGGTTGAINYITEHCSENNLNVLWVDTIQQNLNPLYLRYFHPTISQFKPQFYDYRKHVHELDLFSSHIYFRSGERPESMEGFAFDICVLNEAGIILRGAKGRQLWFNSIYPMLLDRQGICFVIGTPKGLKSRKNEDSDYSLFYELFEKGQSGETGWISKRYSSYCNIEMLSRQIMISNKNRGVELTMEQAREMAITDLNTMANDFPHHIRAQEIYAEFIDKQEESIFHEDWFDIVNELPHISRHKQTVLSIDTAFKIGEMHDYSAGIAVMQTVDNHFYILDIFNDRYEFPQLLTVTKDFYNRFPDCRYVLIEDKVSGIPLIQTLRQETKIPVRAITVSKDKLTRASSITPVCEQKRVHLLRGDWNTAYIDQMCQFNGLFDSPDDLVDASSQALNFLDKGSAPEAKKPISRRVIRTSDSLRGYY